MNEEPKIPKKNPKKRIKKKRITAFFSDEDFEKIENQSKILGITKSEFIRRISTSKKKELDLFKEEHIKIFNQINAIGRNLNQLVKKVNQDNFEDIETDFNRFKIDFEEWQTEYKDFIKKKL